MESEKLERVIPHVTGIGANHLPVWTREGRAPTRAELIAAHEYAQNGGPRPDAAPVEFEKPTKGSYGR